MFQVYKLTNKVNGKIYIGKSKDYLKRFKIHIKIAKGGKEKYPRKYQAIHAAIKKYGKINFILELLYEVNSEKESFDLEREIITFNKVNKIPSYNLSDGGEGNSGWKHSVVSKQKMSDVRRGKSHSEDHCKSLSEAQKGEKSFMYGTHLPIKWKESIGKLTYNDVNKIRKLISEKVKYKEISKNFNISQSTISMIKHNKIWNNYDLDSVSLISKSEINSEGNSL